MKYILLISTFLFAFSIHADELVSSINRPDLEVRMGELTGAGSKIALKSLAGFVHPNGYIMKDECNKIVVKKSVDPLVSDVVKIEVNNLEIPAAELIGIIVKK